MNAALIHLASLECWQRAERLGLTPGVFIVLQIISASPSKNGMRMRTLVRESRLAQATVERHVYLLIDLDLVYRKKMPRGNLPGTIPTSYFLSDKGRALMTPQARAGEATHEGSAV